MDTTAQFFKNSLNCENDKSFNPGNISDRGQWITAKSDCCPNKQFKINSGKGPTNFPVRRLGLLVQCFVNP